MMAAQECLTLNYWIEQARSGVSYSLGMTICSLKLSEDSALQSPFAGVIYAHQMRANIGQCIHDLCLLAECLDPEDLLNTAIHLPFK
jgi:hypothetical protein